MEGLSPSQLLIPNGHLLKLMKIIQFLEVAEKKPISDQATAGIYYWKHGSDYVRYTEQMVKKNIRVNNEFYVCPVYNEAILAASISIK